jgi:hypothetical protein
VLTARLGGPASAGPFYARTMETIVQFIAPGDVFMARGQRHVVRHVDRRDPRRGVLVVGERADGHYFDAEFPWGESVDIIDSALGRASGS